METKFKVGDKVVLTKPTDGLGFNPILERFVGGIFEIYQTDDENNVYYCTKDGLNFWLRGAWLTKAEEETPEEPQANEEKQIDWEQRKWDLASKIYAESENVTLESAIRQAEIFINYYKTKSDENRNY